MTLRLISVVASAMLLNFRGGAVPRAFESFGSWSNVVVSTSGDPHASGYEVDLWKNNGTVVGFMFEYVGPVADPPIGPLQELKFDPQSGSLSFSAKMTTGVSYSIAHKGGAPSRELYLFTGTLRATDLSGVLERQDHLNGGSVTSHVTLKGSAHTDPFWNEKTFKEWQAFYAPILRSRGPRW